MIGKSQEFDSCVSKYSENKKLIQTFGFNKQKSLTPKSGTTKTFDLSCPPQKLSPCQSDYLESLQDLFVKNPTRRNTLESQKTTHDVKAKIQMTTTFDTISKVSLTGKSGCLSQAPLQQEPKSQESCSSLLSSISGQLPQTLETKQPR